jgi:hypothetical protein
MLRRAVLAALKPPASPQAGRRTGGAEPRGAKGQANVRRVHSLKAPPACRARNAGLFDDGSRPRKAWRTGRRKTAGLSGKKHDQTDKPQTKAEVGKEIIKELF